MKILNVAKAALYGIFLNYYCYYVLRGSFIPGGTVLFLAVAIVCVGMDMINKQRVRIGTEFRCWILYTILAFITTALVTGASDLDFIGDIIKFAQRLAITFVVAYICEQERSIRFGMQLMAIVAFAAAVSIILVIDDFRLKLDLSTNADLSANDTGSIMAYGMFAILFAYGKRGKPALLLTCLKVTGIICMVIVIFLTGSRKSAYAVVIMIALFLLLCIPGYWKKFNLGQFFIVLVVGFAAYLFVSKHLLSYAEQTNLYTRMFGNAVDVASDSDEGRIKLYIWAMEDFFAHPLFGLGFNGFRKIHGNYTHSTYAEPLACSGIIGLLYLYPYIAIIKNQIQLILRNERGSLSRLKQKELLVYLAVFLFIGIGIPYMYKDIPCIILGTFIASQSISFDELREKGHTSIDY